MTPLLMSNENQAQRAILTVIFATLLQVNSKLTEVYLRKLSHFPFSFF